MEHQQPRPDASGSDGVVNACRAPGRLLRPAARTAATVIAMVVLAASAAACSSSLSRATSGSPRSQVSTVPPSAVAYSACMRSHDIPNYPDPDANGQLPKGDAQHLGISSSQLQAAQHACRPLLPSGGSFRRRTQQCLLAGDCPQAVVQQILTVQRRYARCMRSHGVPNFPDPTIDSQGRPFFDVSKTGMTRSSTRSASFTSSDGVCERLVGIDGDVPVDF